MFALPPRGVNPPDSTLMQLLGKTLKTDSSVFLRFPPNVQESLLQLRGRGSLHDLHGLRDLHELNEDEEDEVQYVNIMDHLVASLTNTLDGNTVVGLYNVTNNEMEGTRTLSGILRATQREVCNALQDMLTVYCDASHLLHVEAQEKRYLYNLLVYYLLARAGYHPRRDVAQSLSDYGWIRRLEDFAQSRGVRLQTIDHQNAFYCPRLCLPPDCRLHFQEFVFQARSDPDRNPLVRFHQQFNNVFEQ